MTDQEKIEVIQGKIDGKEIEGSFINEDDYSLQHDPDFNFTLLKYRIRKEEHDRKIILNNFLRSMRIACDGEEESFTYEVVEDDNLMDYTIRFTIKKDG